MLLLPIRLFSVTALFLTSCCCTQSSTFLTPTTKRRRRNTAITWRFSIYLYVYQKRDGAIGVVYSIPSLHIAFACAYAYKCSISYICCDITYTSIARYCIASEWEKHFTKPMYKLRSLYITQWGSHSIGVVTEYVHFCLVKKPLHSLLLTKSSAGTARQQW